MAYEWGIPLHDRPYMDLPIVVPTRFVKRIDEEDGTEYYEVETKVRYFRTFVENKPALDTISAEDMITYSGFLSELGRREEEEYKKAESEAKSKTPSQFSGGTFGTSR